MGLKKRNSLLMVLFIGVLMGALDIAIIGPAMPAIRKEFGVGERLGAWIFSIYVLFNLIGTPIMAKLSDLFGRRGVYILDVALFACGSLISALAPSFGWLILGRGIQGFGAGGIFPVASAVIGDTFPAEKRGGALGLIGAVFGIAFLFGPPLGGVITTLWSWHWLFLINLPIAVVVIVLSIRLLPSERHSGRAAFDWPGMTVLALMLASMAYGINQIDKNDFFTSLASLQVWPFMAAFLILFGLLTRIEKQAEAPLLPPYLFSRRQLSLAYALSTGAGIGEASLVFIPALALAALPGQVKTSLSASYMMMPVVLAMAVGSPLAGRMLDRVGSRTVILSGTAVMTGGFFLLALFPSSMPLFIISGALIGAGLSALLGAPMRYIMLNESAASERSIAQGVLVLFSSAGQLASGAMVGAIAAGGSYGPAFLLIAVLGLVMVGLAIFLKNQANELVKVKQSHTSTKQNA